jgi:simple sugar transport system ATP-binding protein
MFDFDSLWHFLYPGGSDSHFLVPSMSVEENLPFGIFNPPFSRHGLLDFSAIRSSAVRRIGQFGINVARSTTPVQTLSGGNQQKLSLRARLDAAQKC